MCFLFTLIKNIEINNKNQIATQDILSSESFASDLWKTIVINVRKGNTGVYGKGTYTICGFVIEFEDIITERTMNSTEINTGGWSHRNANIIQGVVHAFRIG